MIVIDAYGAIALLRREAAASDVQQLLESSSGAVLTVVGVAEVLDRLVRLGRIEADEAVLDLKQLALDDPPELDPETARRAGLLRAQHYHRRDRIVSLADCVAAETARKLGVPLATPDPHLIEMCLDEGIEVIPLPDRQGNVWTP